jgi:hypothetical protein
MENNNETSPSTPNTLSFSINLWVKTPNYFIFLLLQDKFEMIQKTSGDHRKLLEDFANIIQDRIEIEENYSKAMEKIAFQLTSFLDKG